MERQVRRLSWRTAGVVGAVALLAWLARDALVVVCTQLAGGYVLMSMALPMCRMLEKKLSPGLAAGLSFLILAAAAAGVVVGVVPPLIKQFRQLAASFPALLSWVQELLIQGQQLLAQRGLDVTPVRDELFSAISSRAGDAVSNLAGMAGQVVSALSKLFLAPLIGFYLLRDRRKIASFLVLMIPVRWRARAVRAAREMRRETAGFLRGQLLVSVFVAALTAAGLALVGTPGWMLLGLLMGILELVPYIGPVLAGIPAVLLALQGGLWQALWTLLVLLAVQQIEGSLLSPRLLSGATRLHPLVVLLSVSAGGILAGTFGMLLALPLVVSLRGALRGLRR